MGELSSKLDRLGDALAEASDRQARDGALADARRRFLASSPRASRSTGRLVAWATALAACMACVVAVVAWRLGPKADMGFVVGAPPVAGKLGEWVAADGEALLPVRFADGSSLELEPGGRLRVSESSADGAVVLVERGTVRAAIEHTGPKTHWQIHAGPFAVQVTGTRFDASWEPQSETFELRVVEGSVAVSGPLLPPARPVVGGERLVVSVKERRMDLSRLSGSQPTLDAGTEGTGGAGATSRDMPSSESIDAGAAGAASCPASASATSASAPGAGTAASASDQATKAWRELLAARKYQEAWAEIERRGFEHQMEGASASDLLALSDAARFAGQPERAKQALLALRQRHGASGHSAFLLGRISADQLGSPGEAVRWFETYLREEPSGALAEQALGRILDIQRHGSPEAARLAAERYLARFPNGAYATLAHSVLGP
jgi:transmembrane sensor